MSYYTYDQWKTTDPREWEHEEESQPFDEGEPSSLPVPELNEGDVVVSHTKLSIDDDYGTETYIKTIYANSLLNLRRAVRMLSPGSIPIWSPYDCTGLVCHQRCKMLKIYPYHSSYIAVVELTVTRDV